MRDDERNKSGGIATVPRSGGRSDERSFDGDSYELLLRLMSEPDEKEKTRLKNVAQGLTEKIDKLRDGDRDAQREALAKMAVVSETAAYHYAVWAKSSCRNLEATRTYMQIAMGAMKTSTQCHLALSALEVRQIEHETKDESEASAAQQNPETGAGNG